MATYYIDMGRCSTEPVFVFHINGIKISLEMQVFQEHKKVQKLKLIVT